MASRTPSAAPRAGEQPPATARAPRRRLSVDERREQLIAVALQLFSDRAPEDVSIDDIAAAAGASRPLVYHYFPGKQALYEEALRRAGHELAGRFEEPGEGPLSERLHRVMGRYLDFVQSHAAGFTALLRGGSVAASPDADAVIDQVRRAAQEQILLHLGAPDPSPTLRRTVRAWIANAEISSLDWLTDKPVPVETLQLHLVQELVAALTVAAARDPELASLLGEFFADERPDGPAALLLRDLTATLSAPALTGPLLRLATPPAP
ncbi:TetR/AcrR family transcriptional regulator [Kitasatospora phosalacinea]|uniref:TetR/AcrR family transcriptional regulator n=1 Tax=Kitasatospora phosalacinea TaxID=2065 RepID=UPI000A7E6470|nr:TetR/AcrR family transcriptional regulator [Kitasatospora phosalacinea]